MQGNHRLLRKVNRTRIMNTIRRKGPVTIAETARETGLTFPAVSGIVKELMEMGILQVKGVGTSSGGRKPLLYELNPQAIFAAGVDLSVHEIRIGLMDLETRWVGEKRVEAPMGGKPEEYVRIIAGEFQRLVEETGIDENRILGMGVSVPGPVDSETGTVYSPPNLPGWGEVSLKRRLEETLRLVVKVEKDANLAALGERWFGAGQDVDHFLYVFVGEGIGGGLIIGGFLHRGTGFGAGEIGHATLDLDGPRCNCGNYGCLEAMASGLALVRRTGEELRRGAVSPLFTNPDDVTFEAVLRALRAGDPLAESLAEEASRLLGIGLAGVIHAFLPQKVIIGGKLPQAFPRMVEIARTKAKERLAAVFRDRLDIVEAKLGDSSAITGAATLVLEQLFTFQWRSND
jgi:glucokinase-like ROK family protein